LFKRLLLFTIFTPTFVLTLAPAGAFVAVALALRSYNKTLAITAIVHISVLGVIIFGLWVYVLLELDGLKDFLPTD
jgi:hypothetical protein